MLVDLIEKYFINKTEFLYFKDSTRAQFEERQNDVETKLAELRLELEKLNKNEKKKIQSDEEEEEGDDNMKVDDNQNTEDQSLQETLTRVKLEEQIMRVEEIVSLYKVKNFFKELS